MTIYTIGFTQKSAQQFFELIKENEIQLLVDVRLNNTSQLAGFSKGSDLSYFLESICSTRYVHATEYAPTKQLLVDYKKGKISWEEYEIEFDKIMEQRKCCDDFVSRFGKFDRVCLLCSEATPEHCHRRLVAEKIQSLSPDIKIAHL